MQRIFLTGLPGSGKSTVGRRIAAMLGWQFFDTDDLLAERAGMPVGEALVNLGEERFRQLESEILREVASRERVVVATGGGIVISKVNRELMRERGMLVYLSVPVDIAWERVTQHQQESGAQAFRPLIAGPDGKQRLQELYRTRQAWYEEAPIHIAIEERSTEQVARKLAACAISYGYVASAKIPREIITLKLGNITSEAVVEWGNLPQFAQMLRSLEMQERVFVVTDSQVGELYAQLVKNLLEEVGFAPQIFTVPAGESSKSLPIFEQILDWLVEQKAERKEAIIALGGGVVGDLAGFVAASYHRGVPLIQVPTTLLAQVDSAIGGKTGINHPRGKNLIGAFYQPQLIYADPAFLLTLPERVYLEGWAEIVKYGVILDAELFDTLERRTGDVLARNPTLLSDVIARCIRIKMDVVQHDEREGGLRALLNYGHTFGHALEAITDYGRWLHGEAVSIGMQVAAHIAVARGLFSREAAQRQTRLLSALGLPVRCPGVNIEAILEAMQRDKKVQVGRTRWILPERIGHASIYGDVESALVREAILAVCGNT
jgi:3-dehydroquinate synthase